VFIKDVRVRQYIYGIVIAAGALALIYGIVNSQQLGGWIALGGAILGISNGLALANTSDGKHEAP
jgi:hypothetical protein